VLGPQPQRGPTRGQDLHASTARHQLVEHRRHFRDLLQVVENQQSRGVADVVRDHIEWCSRAFHRRAERAGDTWQHQIGLVDRRQRNEGGTVGESRLQLLAHSDGQTPGR
jgi:hypothetical protein